MHFIQFQIIVDDEYQQLIKIKYENLKSSEITLKYRKKMFIFNNIEIPFHGLGIWQYIFIQSTNNYTNIKWYSNFVLIKDEQYKDYQKIKNVELLQKEYIQVEFIHINSIQDTVKICHSQQQITIRFDPQLSKIKFGDFNNNMFIIGFWVKYNDFHDLNNDLIIKVYDKKTGVSEYALFNYFNIFISKYRTTLSMIINEISLEYTIKINEWTYFNIEFNRLNRYVLFKFYLKQQYEAKQFQLSDDTFISELQLQITKSRQFLLTEIHLDLDYFNDIYCIPGCLACQDNICLQCGQDLILIDGECICNDELFFSASECFFPDFEYFTIKESIENQVNQQKNCPQYDSQNCNSCLDQNEEWEYPFCQYSYATQWFYDQYEFLDFNLIMVIFYQQEADSYIIDQSMTIQKKSQIYKTNSNNMVLFHQSNYQIYQLGIYTNTNYSRIQCQENYFGRFCIPKIKNCLNQLDNKSCFQCKENYYNIQSKCKRCPQNCERCIMDTKSRIKCVKCSNQYFLTMDYKCEWCSLEYCTICYEFDDDQMSLQEISFKQNNQVKQIGCAQCKLPYFLNLQNRTCQVDHISFEYLQQCDKGCMHCQKEICLMCEQGSQDIDLIRCSLDKQQFKTNYKKIKQNQIFDNFWKLNAISTFLYHNYDYTHIIKNQTNYIIFDCEFPQLKNNDKEFYCMNKIKEYIGLRRSSLTKLYTFIQFMENNIT